MESGSNFQSDKLTDTRTGRLVLLAIGAVGISALVIWFYLLW
jgi:hypothetical protein